MIGSLGSSGSSASGSIDDLLKLLTIVSDPVQVKAALEELRALLKSLNDKQAEIDAAAQEVIAHRKANDITIEQIAEVASANDRRRAELDERARVVEAEFAKLAAEQTRVEQARAAFEADATVRYRDLTARTIELDARTVALDRAEKDVAALKADLQVRIDRIKAAAA